MRNWFDNLKGAVDFCYESKHELLGEPKEKVTIGPYSLLAHAPYEFEGDIQIFKILEDNDTLVIFYDQKRDDIDFKWILVAVKIEGVWEVRIIHELYPLNW